MNQGDDEDNKEKNILENLNNEEINIDTTTKNPEEEKISEPRKTALDSLRICLFCNKECIDHMRIKHSFFILDIECVINLKGLVTYIAERIQLGYLCLFCSKMFKDSTRCQQHMIDKSHCFMNPEDEHEYAKFYDFSIAYKEFQKKNVEAEGLKDENKKEGEQEWEDVDFEDANDEELEEIEESVDDD